MEAIFIKNPYLIYTTIAVSLISLTLNRKNFYYVA